MRSGTSPDSVRRLLSIASSAIEAVGGREAVAAAVAGPELAIPIGAAGRVFGVSVGKAAPQMHAGLFEHVPAKAWGGGIVVGHRPGVVVPGARYLVGEHPLPGPGSEAAGRTVLHFLESARPEEGDLVVFCVSGGTSSLIAAPLPGLEPGDLAAVSSALLRSGVGIAGTNAVRRLLSRTHNGRLAAAAGPARIIGLLMNDVPGASLADVGSGPTFPAVASAGAEDLIHAHVAEPVRSRALAVLADAPPATVRLDVDNVEVAGPARLLQAVERAARGAGLSWEAWPEPATGDAARMADRVAETLTAWRAAGRSGACLAAVGEVSVRVTGPGLGGRCQQLAWELVPRLASLPGAAAVAVATDGRDHIPGVGGAWATARSAAAVEAAGLSWDEIAAANDSHRGLAAIGQLLPERDTGSNVADLYLAALDPV